MEDLLDHSEKTPARLKFDSRFGSSLLDGLITMLITVVLTLAILAVDGFQSNFMEYYLEVIRYCTWFFLLVEIFTGLSAGKLLLKYRLGDERGYPAALNQMIIRGSIKAIPSIVSLVILYIDPELTIVSSIVAWLYMLSCLTALSGERQAMHDRIAGTAVYKMQELL